VPCTPDNTCVHRLAAGWINAGDLCPVCTSYLIAGLEWIMGEQLTWHPGYLRRASGQERVHSDRVRSWDDHHARGKAVTEREYGAVCVAGHCSYLRLRTTEPEAYARCTECGETAKLTVLLPVSTGPDAKTIRKV